MTDTVLSSLAVGAGLIAIVPILRWLYAFGGRRAGRTPMVWMFFGLLANALDFFASGPSWLRILSNFTSTISGTLVVVVCIVGYADNERRARERKSQV